MMDLFLLVLVDYLKLFYYFEYDCFINILMGGISIKLFSNLSILNRLFSIIELISECAAQTSTSSKLMHLSGWLCEHTSLLIVFRLG